MEQQSLEREVEGVRTYPDRNPNPVLRIATSGVLLYANGASAPLLRAIGAGIGDRLPDKVLARLRSMGDSMKHDPLDVQAAGRTYRLRPVPIDNLGCINIYGTDVTGLQQRRWSAG